MFKRVTTDFKAAVTLIAAENVAALRGLTKTLFKSARKGPSNRRYSKTKDAAGRET
ncbi:MAG: hypothetical protein JW837_08525 [Sedimentisphaerales bacterium]|nr:hypothetical protein [Sedimentisphaerales bacterium]